MASQVQVRDDSKMAVLFKELGPMRHRPLVGIKQMNDVLAVVADLPALAYPIRSAGELIDMIGGRGRVIDIFGVPMQAAMLVRGMPAHYFPIVSAENFVEKIAELLRRSRGTVNMVKELGRIRPHLPKMRFPLHSVDDVLHAFASVESLPATSPRLPPGHQMTVSAAQIRAWITERMKPEVFPIHSEAELYAKAMRLIPQGRHPRRR